VTTTGSIGGADAFAGVAVDADFAVDFGALFVLGEVCVTAETHNDNTTTRNDDGRMMWLKS
jgi:hypothetical protein